VGSCINESNLDVTVFLCYSNIRLNKVEFTVYLYPAQRNVDGLAAAETEVIDHSRKTSRGND